MPNSMIPHTEGERMDSAEVLRERSRQVVESRLRNHPLRVVEFAEELGEIALIWEYWSGQSMRPEATLSDKLNAGRYQDVMADINAWLDETFRTPAGMAVLSLVVDKIAAKTAVIS